MSAKPVAVRRDPHVYYLPEKTAAILAVTSKSPEEISCYVLDLLSDLLGIPAPEIKRHHRFTEDLRADELEPVEIAMALEEDLGLAISDEEASTLTTVGDLIDFLAKRLEERVGPPRSSKALEGGSR